MIVRKNAMALTELPIVHWPTIEKTVNVSRQSRSKAIVARPLYLDEVIAFGASGNADSYLFGDDCHVPEQNFRWTKRSVCRAAFNAMFKGPVDLMLRMQLMVQRPWDDLQLSVTLNGENLEVDRPADQSDTIRLVTGDLLRPTENMNILIVYSEPKIIGQINGGSDMRNVGIGLKALWFTREG